MKILLSELEGSALDFAVARSAGLTVGHLEGYPESLCVGSKGRCIGVLAGVDIKAAFQHGYYDPHKNWQIAGPLMEKFQIAVLPQGSKWFALTGSDDLKKPAEYYDSMIEAAMRCIVKHYCPEVKDGYLDVPEKLVRKRPALKLVAS